MCAFCFVVFNCTVPAYAILHSGLSALQPVEVLPIEGGSGAVEVYPEEESFAAPEGPGQVVRRAARRLQEEA
jgi:hypothetical protein